MIPLEKIASSLKDAFKECLIPDWTTHSPILLLPSEVRAPIWDYLNHTERKNIRSTCTTFKNEIDTCTGISIDLDERRFDALNIDSTLPPSASKIRIWGAERTNDYLSRLLYNARLIRDVTFTGPSDMIHLKKIIKRCQNLISITLTEDCQFDSMLRIPFKLRNVKIFRVGVEEKVQSDSFHWPMYDDIFTNLTFPCLKTLQIQLTLSNQDSTSETYCLIFSQLIKYLLNHKTVNDLTIRLHKSLKTSFSKTSSSLPQFSEESLQSLNLKSLTVSTDPECGAIWETILLNQKNLYFLDFLNQSKDWLLFPKIIKNNRRSLKVLKLRRLLPDIPLERPSDRVDLGSFEFVSCPQLEELFLSRFENSTSEVCQRKGDQALPFLDRTSSKFPELIRLSSLPQSLKKLAIQGFTVKTEDLMLIPSRLENLQLLELQLLGYNNNGGSGERKEFEEEKGGGDGDSLEESGSGDKMRQKDISTLWREEEFYKATGVNGFGVTPAVLKGLITKLRKLDTLFLEEFDNEHTSLGKEPGLGREVHKINLIPGDCRLSVKAGGYFGVLINANKDGVRGLLEASSSRADLWDERFNLYLNQYKERGRRLARHF